MQKVRTGIPALRARAPWCSGGQSRAGTRRAGAPWAPPLPPPPPPAPPEPPCTHISQLGTGRDSDRLVSGLPPPPSHLEPPWTARLPPGSGLTLKARSMTCLLLPLVPPSPPCQVACRSGPGHSLCSEKQGSVSGAHRGMRILTEAGASHRHARLNHGSVRCEQPSTEASASLRWGRVSGVKLVRTARGRQLRTGAGAYKHQGWVPKSRVSSCAPQSPSRSCQTYAYFM